MRHAQGRPGRSGRSEQEALDLGVDGFRVGDRAHVPEVCKFDVCDVRQDPDQPTRHATRRS